VAIVHSITSIVEHLDARLQSDAGSVSFVFYALTASGCRRGPHTGPAGNKSPLSILARTRTRPQKRPYLDHSNFFRWDVRRQVILLLDSTRVYSRTSGKADIPRDSRISTLKSYPAGSFKP
jgi:hypothetical protein